ITGTAEWMRKNLSIPVVSLQAFTTLDLLENLYQATRLGKKIGIYVYGTPLTSTDVVEKLMRIKIEQVVYKDFKGLRAGCLGLKKEGFDVAVGRNLASKVCSEIGLPFIFCGISEERLSQAMDEAVHLASIHREEREKTSRIEAMLNSVSEGVIAIDRNGLINIFNSVAQELLGMNGCLGKHIDELLLQFGLCEILKTGTPKMRKLLKIKEVQVIANLTPIYLNSSVIGAIASFTSASNIIRAEQSVRRSNTKGFIAKYVLGDIVCENGPMKNLTARIQQFALSDSTTLITGESGTGKELVAHSIHNLSARKNFPFVPINCSALPENLLESELFGYERGAFTGARKDGKQGLFELAHQGSIFLDKIGSISPSIQSRLLRALQQKELLRISGDRIIPVDVRIIAATNMDILKMVKQGRMSIDLYFRLNVLRLHVPPLRERKEDIPALVVSLLERHSHKYGKQINWLTDKAMTRFLAYSWPGNIRELDNFIEKFVIITENCDQAEKTLDLLFEECLETERVLFKDDETKSFPFEELKNSPEAFYKKKTIAKLMGISRTTLWRKMKNPAPAKKYG
ncbi:MAG: sigma 54-interacting transcriptional regulator, partial [Syntrophaceae bacterium]|nr:sigma 54-interacting transcriptional regulator [Syntrophaceae bacterium]